MTVGAASTTWLASRAFVAAPPAAQPLALRGSAAGADAVAESAPSGGFSAPAGAMLIGASALSVAMSKTKTRSARRAEPPAAPAAAGVSGGAATLPAEEAEVPVPVWDPSKEVGVTAPFGYFDPANIAEKYDQRGFRALRNCEIKHGRVAMMASIGAVGQHFIKFPGFENVPSGVAAVATGPGAIGLAVLTVVSGIVEMAVWTDDLRKEPGNFGDPFGLNMYNEEMRTKELNNGRAAMIAVLGIVMAELSTGKDGMQQLGF